MNLSRTYGLKVLALALMLASAGCEGDDATGDVATGAAPVVTGREQIVWDQDAPSAAEVAGYTFEAVVDGGSAVRLAARCNSGSASGSYECSAPIPALAPGSHTLSLRTTDARGMTSGLAAALSLVVQAASNLQPMASLLNGVRHVGRVCLGNAADGGCYEAEPLASGLAFPTQPTVLPDGQLLVIDNGTLLTVTPDGARAADYAIGADARVADLVAPPARPFTGELFLLETTVTGQSRSADVVRVREVNGVLGERAVVVPGIALPADGDPVLLVDDHIVVAIPQSSTGNQPGILVQYDRQGRAAGVRIGTPVLAWGPGRPSAMRRSGDSLTVAGLTPGDFVLGDVQAGATAPLRSSVAQRVAALGGVRDTLPVGADNLLATGDGSLLLLAAASQERATDVRRIDTKGAVITGLARAADGSIVVAGLLPFGDPATRGVLYRFVPQPAVPQPTLIDGFLRSTIPSTILP